jgi:hypothetical protein
MFARIRNQRKKKKTRKMKKRRRTLLDFVLLLWLLLFSLFDLPFHQSLLTLYLSFHKG